MFSRFIALLLALALLGPAFATAEQAISVAAANTGQVDARSAADPAQFVLDRSVDDHGPDEPAAQALAEGPTDLPDLFMPPPERQAAESATVLHVRDTVAARPEPCVNGLRRPPRARPLPA